MTEHPALVGAAGFGLPGDRPPVVLAASDAAAVLQTAGRDRLGGFLGRAVEHGAVEVDDVTLASVLEAWQRELVLSVTVEAMAVRVARVLDEAGVVWRLTKGAAVAHLDYRDPSMRTFGDVDLLVHPASWPAALEVLERAGYHRQARELRPGFDLRFGKGATLTAADGDEVDLHLRFAIGRFGVTSRPQDLFEPPVLLTLGGRDLPCLSAEARLLHACYHATLGGFRHLRALRDVAQIALVSGADWEAVVARATAWRAGAVVATAVLDTWSTFGLDADHGLHQWAGRHGLDRGERAAIQVFREERPFRDQALTALNVLPVWGWPRYLYGLAGSRRRG